MADVEVLLHVGSCDHLYTVKREETLVVGTQ